MATRKIQFYAGALEKDLEERTLNEEQYSSSAIAQRDLQRYYLLMRRSLPTFTLNQARVLVNALAVSGVYTGQGTPPAWPVDRAPIWAHVTEAIEGAAVDSAEHSVAEASRLEYVGESWDPTYGIDTNALTARLRTLTPCMERAIRGAVERLCFTEEDGGGLEDAELVRVGLARSDRDMV